MSFQRSLKPPGRQSAREKSMEIRKKAAAPGLGPRDALDILEIRASEVQTYLAQHADVDEAVLRFLAEHGAPAVRQAVAANPATPAPANRILADDDDEDVRAELAAKIARLMPGLEPREGDHVVALTIETLERLAADTSVRVRAILSEEIKLLDCVPRSVALTLARDLESVVAAPILEYSPLLSDADLIEIIACGKVQETLAAIARRRPLHEDVTDVLVKALDVPGVAALLVNPDAHIRQETLERIVEQAQDIDAWHMPLVLRTDLSARAIRRISGFVGVALIELLAERNNLDKETKAHLSRRLRARLDERPANTVGVTPETARQLVAEALAQGKLDDAFVEEAVFAGNREVVVCALATLARAPEATVRKILSSGHAKPLVALAWHAQLSMRVAFKIQGMIMKLPAGALLPARGGVHFPMTADQMRWHLDYFDIKV
jgi:uncharacterized protein (DUF2336 family)